MHMCAWGSASGSGPRWGWPGPWYGPGYAVPAYPYSYPYGYPYIVPPVVVQPAPPAYAPAPPYYWYYCGSAQAYYPYVAQCPEGWMRVVPPTGPPPGAGAEPQAGTASPAPGGTEPTPPLKP
jgi:hypothetical protein